MTALKRKACALRTHATTVAAPLAAARQRAPAKARTAAECEAFEQLPNVGPALAADLRLLGVEHPQALAALEPFALYQALCARTGRRHDPCVLDSFMAITDFMRGAAAAPWWAYTVQRKRLFGPL